ncbi:hypothetical protein MalM25_27150 [Planctomycetes bacterium MalM25]|nr:hypothetical protein MalM25_27150 [Planctomycetes bacterium MalM25]
MTHLIQQRPIVVTLALLLCATAQADVVRLVSGRSQTGEVTRVTRDAVTLERRGKPTVVPVEQIRAVLFEDEPSTLGQARLNVASGGYETALDALRPLAASAGDGLVGQEIKFYTAFCQARLAIAGQSDAKTAGRLLSSFVKNHGDSFHYYEAVESIGDLYVSLGAHDRAIRMYALTAKSPRLPIKLRAALLAGKASQAAGDNAKAIQRFDAVINAKGDSPLLTPLRRDARLAKATALAASGQLDGALTILGEVLERADENDVAINAAAYNALGRCYDAADRPTDALFAYLHTDLLFDSDQASHAEALARLADLWEEAGKPDAARDAADRLRRQYAATRAAREAGG